MIKKHIAKNGQHYFTVNGRNGKVIVTSETYKTRQGMNKGIKSLNNVIKKMLETSSKV